MNATGFQQHQASGQRPPGSHISSPSLTSGISCRILCDLYGTQWMGLREQGRLDVKGKSQRFSTTIQVRRLRLHCPPCLAFFLNIYKLMLTEIHTSKKLFRATYSVVELGYHFGQASAAQQDSPSEVPGVGRSGNVGGGLINVSRCRRHSTQSCFPLSTHRSTACPCLGDVQTLNTPVFSACNSRPSLPFTIENT